MPSEKLPINLEHEENNTSALPTSGDIREEFPSVHPARLAMTEHHDPPIDKVSAERLIIEGLLQQHNSTDPRVQKEVLEHTARYIKDFANPGMRPDNPAMAEGFNFMLSTLEKIDGSYHGRFRPAGTMVGLEEVGDEIKRVVFYSGFAGRELDPGHDARILKALLPYAGEHQAHLHSLFVDSYRGYLLHHNNLKSPAVDGLWQSPEFLSFMGSRAAGNLDRYDSWSNWPKEEQALFIRALESYGFTDTERQDLGQAWSSYVTKEESGEIIEERRNRKKQALIDSFNVMSRLMTAGAEVPHEIYEKFGIRHFGRYSAQDLYTQYKAFNERQPGGSPITLVVQATYDYNGAFRNGSERYSGLEPIYTEAASLRELATRVLLTRKGFGKIKSLFVAGHGALDSVTLSATEEVTKKQMEQSEALKSIKDRDIFSDDAQIVLFACNTGKSGGIAETVSHISAIDVIAPTVPTTMRVHPKAGGYDIHFSHSPSRGLLGRIGDKLGLSEAEQNAGVRVSSDQGKIKRADLPG